MKLSIITINLNNSDGLRKTIESVVKQFWTDFEFIVIDGASTDNSVDIIRLFGDRLSFWVSEPDKGIYNAMNKGILKATGEYCLFLNSGDWLIENILNEVFSLGFNEDIFYGNAVFELSDKSKLINRGCGKQNLTFYDFYSDTIRHQAAFIKRSLFDAYGLYDESFTIVSDWYFFIKTIIFGKATYKYKDISISHFDMNGIGTVPSIKHIDERLRVLRSFFPDSILQDYEDYHALIQQNADITKELKRYKYRFSNLDRLYSKFKKYYLKIPKLSNG